MGERINIRALLSAAQSRLEPVTQWLDRSRTLSTARRNGQQWVRQLGRYALPLAEWAGQRAGRLLAQNKSMLLLLVPVLVALPIIVYQAFPSKVAVVMSSSMEPTLSPGDMVFLSPAGDFEVGDIVAFNTPGGNPGFPSRLIHRVVEYDRDGARLTTQGDANNDSDPFKVGTESVLGVQQYAIPKAGYLILFFQSQYGKIWLAIVALVFAYPTLAKAGTWARNSAQRALFTGLSTNVDLGGNGPDTKRLDRMETGVSETREALIQFSKAISEYATHMQSHTAAVRGMSEGSQELVGAVHTQNEVLARLREILGDGALPQVKRPTEPTSAPPMRQRRAATPGHYRSRRYHR